MRRLLITLAALLVPLLAAPPPAQAAAPVYVALGDSYASGVGTGSYLDDGSGCQRSSRAYPSLLARARGWTLRFRACSGATTSHVTSSQLGALGSATRYVSLSVGGNDAGFAQVLTTCATPWWLGDCDAAVDRARAFVKDTLPARLATLYDAIRDRAPSAVVVVVGYPRVFMGEDCNLGTWFSPKEQERLNATADLLNRRIATAARAAGFAFADPTSRFSGHAVCDDPEWLNGLSSPISESYHPSRAGHRDGFLPLVRPLLTGASSRVAATSAPAAAPTARASGARTAPFRKPDLGTQRAKQAAKRHGIDIEKWLRKHP